MNSIATVKDSRRIGTLSRDSAPRSPGATGSVPADDAAGVIAAHTESVVVHDASGSGAIMLVGTPAAMPRLWRDYIEASLTEYTDRGVEAALEYHDIRDGASSRLFCVVLDSQGGVIGGLRVQGPYRNPRESHAIREWDGQLGRQDLIAAIGHRIPEGVVEVKSAFVEPTSPQARAAAGMLARLPMIVMELTGCRHVLATAADYVLERWASGGGRVNPMIPATPYPDDRYRTRVMFWDRENLESFAEPKVWSLMNEEFVTALGARVVGVA